MPGKLTPQHFATKIRIAKETGKRQYTLSEGGLLGVAEPGGKLVLYQRYTIRGSNAPRASLRLCRYKPKAKPDEKGSLAFARRKGDKIKAKAKKGVDPKAHREQKIRARELQRIKSVTVEQLLDRYRDEKLSKIKTGNENYTQLSRFFKPAGWFSLEPGDINRQMVKQLLAGTNGPSMEKHLYCYLRAFLNYVGNEKSGTRVLSDDEIRHHWNAIELLPTDPINKPALKLLLLTGQRSNEVCGVQREDISGDWWTLPTSKNGMPHRVYLTETAKRLIAEGLALTNTNAVFGYSSGDEGYKRLSKLCRKLSDANPHSEESYSQRDIRRTVGTGLGKLGVSRFDQDRVLNHKDTSISGVYDVYSYDREKQRAFEKWERYLLQAIEGETPGAEVIPIAV